MRIGWAARIYKLALLSATLLVAFFALRQFPTSMSNFGAWAKLQAPWHFVGLATLACALGVPRQAVSFGAGYSYGAWLGTALALTAETTGCFLNFVWARFVARSWVQAQLQRPNSRSVAWIRRVDDTLAERPFTATLSLRLLPVGNNLVLNLMAGLSRTRLVPFVLGSAVGFTPQTLIFALLGGGVSVNQSTQMLLGAALFVLSATLGALLLRRRRAE